MQDFGRLQNEMLRACRLVVDTGAHAKHWTRQQMIDYMMANNPMTVEDATRKPSATSTTRARRAYKIGMLKILELREKAKTELGAKFDIRDFHDVVLKNGARAAPGAREPRQRLHRRQESGRGQRPQRAGRRRGTVALASESSSDAAFARIPRPSSTTASSAVIGTRIRMTLL